MGSFLSFPSLFSPFNIISQQVVSPNPMPINTLHYSSFPESRPTEQDLYRLRLVVAELLTSALALIPKVGKRNLVFFNALKAQYLHLTTRNLLHNYPFSSKHTQLFPSYTADILGMPFAKALDSKLYLYCQINSFEVIDILSP